MSFWKYIIKTHWEQKKADWVEYQELRNQAEEASCAVLVARGRLSSVHDVKKYSQPYTCINYIIDENKNMHEQQCPLWHDCRGGVHYLKSKCDLAEQNLEYHNACDNADKARNALNKFWANKFAHVK